ncbi:hypothetical protein PNOK_0904000 [Pyrrhoderma noxium]|uniref:DUF1793-domain-containing protein n=1 Tax=Pyrrhoderma noxium TaxID=2282107 RepID=A0A286U6W8_9AGAM|nr:hypothetical protein PNOK_0904000 [Pyrrhoderma noxium]
MLLSILFSCITGVSSQASGWNPEPFNPPNLPLAVKSPYVNCWLPQGPRSATINNLWPQIWDNLVSDSLILGWNAGIRVDGQAYNLLGVPGVANYTNANQTNVLFTPTRTSFLLTADTVDVNMTFLSPIEAHDLTRLSMPFSYLYLSATSNDNNPHEIQFFSDISGEWITGDSSLISTWAPEELSDFISLRMQLASEGKYQEIQNRPQDAVVYHSVQKRSGLSWEINPAVDIREAFANGTGLQNRTDNNFHAVDNPFDTLGISIDIGTIQPGTQSDPVVYTIGVVRDPVIQYTNGDNQLEERNAYYWANFSTVDDVIKDALDHFDDALTASIELDNKLISTANSISTEYAGLISLVTRSAMSAIEYTILKNNQNISDVKAFMKNMGNVGSGQVNAVDVIYAAMPIYLYLNPDIIGYLLSPLLDAQLSSLYTNPFSAMDLGGPFPNATGNTRGHNQGIEQSANMIILTLVHAQASGSGNLMSQYYDLLSKWGDYLVDNTLSPTDQTTSSSDNIKGINQTNLILKGIIGIKAMSQISFLTGHGEDVTKYKVALFSCRITLLKLIAYSKTKADQYYQSWETLAIVSDRIVLNFGGFDSGLIYNLYADKLLGLNVVNGSVKPSRVKSLLTELTFYIFRLAQQQYGVPLDTSNSSLSRTDWMMFAASATTDIQVRNSLINQIYNYATTDFTNKPFPIIYDPSDGQRIIGLNSPAQGAIFAPLALTVNQSITVLPPDPRSGEVERHSSTGAVVGGVVGGMAAVVISIACFIFYRRRQRKKEVSRYNQNAGHSRIQEPPIARLGSIHGFTSSNTRLSSPEPGDMSQVSRNRDHNDTTPIPFYLPDSSVSSSVQNSSPKGRSVNSRSASQSIATPRSNSGTGQSSNSSGEAWREEVNNLRMEIERIREETAPPSYQS